MFRIVVCLLVVASASCTRSDKGLVFKYANEQPEAAIRSQSMLYFEEELEKIFKKVWIPVCHESELPEPYDFRTASIAREPIIVCRGPDKQVRAFLNVCPRRQENKGNLLQPGTGLDPR